ncbi:rhombosortase [Shewanella cyperi]|uniref:Rhombosortase n=1 Tax=Shewanella cyperi TaxID=2814292 RepID=A0A975ALW5_9GAMM|nr:rhombosortase [Shewanella cyperi]QSX31635.1 rhombosortase [Shewanella cyperi]
MSALSSPNRAWLAPLIVSLLSIGLFFLSLDDVLAFRRDAIDQGEYWRLISGNLLHTNHWHLLMNLAGLWVIYSLHHFHYRIWPLLALLLALCTLEGLGLYLGYPQLWGYVGLSGILHGLFAFGALLDIRRGYRSGYLLLLGVILKVSWENTMGASNGVTELIGARVATESHLVGLVSGIALGLLWLAAATQLKPGKEHIGTGH